jgi:glycosyltransferase involved in cell wall biosynthesis
VLILGTAEWDAPIATNQHYVARELAQSAVVDFVESLGLRTPKLNRADMVRMAGRVRRFVGRSHTVGVRRPRPEQVRVVSPLVVPLHRAPTRVVNRTLLRRATASWLGGGGPRVLWTFTPVTYGLETEADVVVYHCVDLLATFPGVDRRAVGRGERRLAQRATVAIATSGRVQQHLREVGFPRVTLLPNVADVGTFTSRSRPASQRRPAVLFAGNLSPHKLDADLLEAVARAVRGRAELLLAGPIAAGGGSFGPQVSRLEALGASYLGVLTLEQLADVAGGCTVGLIPYQLNDYTRGVSPLKCFEYLASGLGVVSTRLEEVERVAGVNPHIVAGDAKDLPDRVLAMLERIDDGVIHSRIESATVNGWAERGQVLRELLANELAMSQRGRAGAGS